MSKILRKRYGGLSLLFLICGLLAAALILTGCEPLRKKFTRKKKEGETTTEAPILEPIDYPEKIRSSQEMYRNSYSLWQGWSKELTTGLIEQDSIKRLLYLLSQMISQLEKMQQLISGEKQFTLAKNVEALRTLKSELEGPLAGQNFSAIKIQIDSIEKAIRINYSFNKIKDSLKTQLPEGF